MALAAATARDAAAAVPVSPKAVTVGKPRLGRSMIGRRKRGGMVE